MKKSYFKYLFALLMFGSNGLVASFISLTSYEIVLLRSSLGSALLLVIFFLTGHRFTAFHNRRALLFIALSGFAMAANWLLLFEAYAQIGVSLGMLINYTGPAIVVAFSALLFKEHITWNKIIALLAALAGVFMISGQAAVEGISSWGLICAILSAFSYAVMVVLNKKAENVTGIENATLQLLFATVAIAALVGFKQGLRIEIAADDWLPVLWLGLINTGVCCYLYFSSMCVLPVQTVAICSYLEPLSAVILSVVFLHETLLPMQIFGAVLIIGGAVVGECISPKKA